MECWGDPVHHTCIKDGDRPYIIWKPQQVTIDTANSVARCTTDKNDVPGEPPIKSGELTTFKAINQKYGWFECRMKVCPGGHNFWNAFLLYNKATGWLPEVDIAEFDLTDSKGFAVNVHAENTSVKTPHASFALNFDLAKEFHIYALNWTKNKLEFYLDNVLVFETRDLVPQVPLYVLVGNGIKRWQTVMTWPRSHWRSIISGSINPLKLQTINNNQPEDFLFDDLELILVQYKVQRFYKDLL